MSGKIEVDEDALTVLMAAAMGYRSTNDLPVDTEARILAALASVAMQVEYFGLES